MLRRVISPRPWTGSRFLAYKAVERSGPNSSYVLAALEVNVIQRTLSSNSGGVIELVARYLGSRQSPKCSVTCFLFFPSGSISQMFQESLGLRLAENKILLPSNLTSGSAAAKNSAVNIVKVPSGKRSTTRLPFAGLSRNWKLGEDLGERSERWGIWVRTSGCWRWSELTVVPAIAESDTARTKKPRTMRVVRRP